MGTNFEGGESVWLEGRRRRLGGGGVIAAVDVSVMNVRSVGTEKCVYGSILGGQRISSASFQATLLPWPWLYLYRRKMRKAHLPFTPSKRSCQNGSIRKRDWRWVHHLWFKESKRRRLYESFMLNAWVFASMYIPRTLRQANSIDNISKRFCCQRCVPRKCGIRIRNKLVQR